ncbi:rod shape-determining protein MreD [Flavobacterium sp. SM15]|uniref:rod shape-determining protein MreD n=1 Tax=Flavobacterium sp. SM15 TaxID=2908005 RepID=UPI001EDA1E8A|nr:rod shape-determining protein MreD [Flavobacterium sp. SM15]MCG2609960.1 rod shape-determining protein MreD [Flavobacterium sp. SM15]
MNSTLILNCFRFVALLALQVVIFNNINFLGYVNPLPYILFIILYPVNGNRAGLLAASFLLGLIMDMFCNSGGVHATACVVLAFMRPSIFRFSFGISYEYQTVKIAEKLSPERFSFILISIVIHHFVLYLLEIFRFNFFWEILLRTLLSALFTLILCVITIYLIKPSKR